MCQGRSKTTNKSPKQELEDLVQTVKDSDSYAGECESPGDWEPGATVPLVGESGHQEPLPRHLVLPAGDGPRIHRIPQIQVRAEISLSEILPPSHLDASKFFS